LEEGKLLEISSGVKEFKDNNTISIFQLCSLHNGGKEPSKHFNASDLSIKIKDLFSSFGKVKNSMFSGKSSP
jgi:hypothetical protein